MSWTEYDVRKTAGGLLAMLGKDEASRVARLKVDAHEREPRARFFWMSVTLVIREVPT